MAKLPRYRALGVTPSSLPGVNFAATGQAQARVAQTIASSLDRMSSFAFREAEVQAQIEGAEYGAGNAPTPQQLIDAQTPEEREELMPGGKGTVYDRAARKAALSAVSSDLEVSARNQISALRLAAAESEMPTAKLQQQIDSVINGYSGAMYDISPAYARPLRAGISTVGNSALVAHSNKIAEIRAKEDKVKAIRSIDTIISGVGDFVAIGEVPGGVSINEVLTVERNKIFHAAADSLDPTLAKQMLDKFDDAVDKAFVGEVRDWVVESPNAHRLELMMGKVEDPRIKSIVGNMTSEQMREAVDASFEVTSRELGLEASLDSKLARVRQEKSIGLRGDIATEMAFPGRTGQDVEALLSQLELIDPEAALTMRSAAYSSAAANNPDAIIGLDRLEAAGQMTHEALMNALDNHDITMGEYRKRYGKLDALKDEDYAEAVTILRNAIQPEVSPLFPSAAEKERIKQIGKIQNELILAKRRDPGLDPIAWIENKLKTLEPAGASPEQIKAAQDLVDAWGRQNGLDGGSVDEIRDGLYATRDESDRLGWMTRNAKIIEAIKTLEDSQ